MNVYIVRHAIAEEPGAKTDSQRKLTEKGREKMGKVARGLKALGVRLNLILTSPYTRARETAEILADEFRLTGEKMIQSVHLAPDSSPARLVEEIRAHYSRVENLALVGHEPFLSELVSLLLAATPDLQVNFRKGGVCALTLESPKADSRATLEWLLTPSQLALLG